MASPLKPSPPEVVVYRGEVWTDARGYATVTLAEPALRLAAPIAYVLRDLEGNVGVSLTAELENDRFTIQSDEPHVKVAWQVRATQSQSRTKEE